MTMMMTMMIIIIIATITIMKIVIITTVSHEADALDSREADSFVGHEATLSPPCSSDALMCRLVDNCAERS